MLLRVTFWFTLLT